MIIEKPHPADDTFPTAEEFAASFRKHYARIMREWLATGRFPDPEVRKSEPEHP